MWILNVSGRQHTARKGSMRQEIIRHLADGSYRRAVAIQRIGCSREYYLRVRRETGLSDYDDVMGH